MFHLLIIIVSILILLHIWLRYGKFGRLFHKIPGPRSFPIIGNLPLLVTLRSTKTMWKAVNEWQKQWPILKLWSFHISAVITRDPNHIKTLLSCKKNINKELLGYSTFKSFGHNGIIGSGGKLWESRRKILSQAFTPNMLKFYSKRIDAHSKKLIAELLSCEMSTVHDVSHILEKYSFTVACEAIMDYDIDGAREQKGQKFRDAVSLGGKMCYYRFYNPHLQDWMLKFVPAGRRLQKAWKTADDFSEEVIQERRSHHNNNNVFKDYLNSVENLNDDEIRESKRNLSILDVLLLSEQKGLIDNKGIVDETFSLIASGFETSARASTFLLISLAENKKVQDLARQELLDVVGGYGNIIAEEHINDLDYLERCVKESLRLHTIVPFMGRSIDEEMKLSDCTIPVGMEFYLNVFQLHRDPNLWPDPLKFDPDRFLPENLKNQHPFAYIPFSKGLRGCLGAKFAMMEIKNVVAHILYNFYLEPIDRSADFEFDLGATLTVDKTRVKFIRIH